jgi:hypothetical protein
MARPMPWHRPAALTALLAFLVLLVPGTALPTSAADRDGDGLRDAFERRYGVTQLGRADSDRDGVVDSAEDLDGDRLGNLGEQRFGTHPGRRDSDRDGVPDGADDADRDGRSDALEQDARPIPAGLTPSLREAPTDYPARPRSCVSALGDARVRVCALGDRDAPTTVVLFGDSHAEQWLPALSEAGRSAGWQVVRLVKGSCPSASVMTMTQFEADGGRSCRSWRSAAVEWIREHRPDLVILSNLGRYDLIRADGSVIRSEDERERRWRLGLADVLAQLPDPTTGLVLGDTPNMLSDPVACLRQHREDMSACQVRRARAIDERHAGIEQAAAEATGDRYASLADSVCSYDPCPLVQGDTLVWRDMGHLTATFSRRVSSSLREVVAAALAPSPSAVP